MCLACCNCNSSCCSRPPCLGSLHLAPSLATQCSASQHQWQRAGDGHDADQADVLPPHGPLHAPRLTCVWLAASSAAVLDHPAWTHCTLRRPCPLSARLASTSRAVPVTATTLNKQTYLHLVTQPMHPARVWCFVGQLHNMNAMLKFSVRSRPRTSRPTRHGSSGRRAAWSSRPLTMHIRAHTRAAHALASAVHCGQRGQARERSLAGKDDGVELVKLQVSRAAGLACKPSQPADTVNE